MKATTGHLALKDIAELAQVSRPAVSNWRKRYSDFPQPVAESTPRKPLFNAAEVVTWLKQNDFFPEGAEKDLRLASLWATANLLRREVAVEDIPLVVLTLLAIDKDPHFEAPAEFTELTDTINTETLEEVKRGIAQLEIKDYGEAAMEVVDRFLGIGSRGLRSQYATSNSVSNQILLNAAASTDTQHARTVMDPACGIAGSLLGAGATCPDAQLLGVEKNPSTAALARLLVFLNGSNAVIHTGDSLFQDPLAGTLADLLVCEPPFGAHIPRPFLNALEPIYGPLQGARPDDIFLLYAVQHLSPDGYAYVFTSTSSAFRQQFREQRQRLVAQGQVEAVVELPAGVFSSTRIPALLWVLRLGQVEEPLLIDASAHATETIPARIGEWLNAARNRESADVPYKAVTLAEIVTNDGDLTPSTYLSSPVRREAVEVEFETSIKSLNSTVKELTLLSTLDVTTDAIPSSTSFTRLNDLILSGHFERIDGSYEPERELKSGKARVAVPNRNAIPVFVDDFDAEDVLKPGDILLSQVGDIAVWVFEGNGQPWVPAKRLMVLRPTSDEYDPYFIAACLNASANIERRDLIPHRRPFRSLTIPDLNREERTIIAETQRSLEKARLIALQLQREVELVSETMISVVFAGK